jgi:phosphoribosylanthranilate isomerase
MNIKIKICGIRSMNVAQTAVDAGADYLGLNFVRGSKRYIDPSTALEISKKYRGLVNIVGVFQNEEKQTITSIADFVGLDIVQLHGDEDEVYMNEISLPIIKSVIGFDIKNLELPDFILLDRVVQGRGEMVDLKKAKRLTTKKKVFFAGGLTPENVLSVVKQVKPYAVDVAGGIETDGKEDVRKIRQFIDKVRENVNL